MTVQSRILRSLARGETVLDFGRATADMGDHLAAARLNFHIGRERAPLDVSADPPAPEAKAPVPDDGGIESFLETNPQNHTDGGTLELDGASSIASADVGGFTYVFVAGGVDDGISVFRLNANGSLTPVHDVTDAGALELDGARGLSTAMVDGNTYLFAAGQADNGVSAFRVGTNGSLTAVSDVNDDATMLLAGVSDTAAARVGAFTYLYTAGTTENGISIFRVAGDGRLTYLSNHVDTGTIELAGVRTLTTVTIGATAFLIAGGTDDGISVFSIAALTGALTHTDSEVDGGVLNLNDVNDITTAVIGGVTYVFVAGGTSNGVSVFSLSAAGALTSIDNEDDSAATLIAGANSVSVHTNGGVSFLLVGGSESGLSVYRIENGSNSNFAAGTLTFLDNIADAGSYELSGIVSTGSGNVGGTSYILGAGETDDGISAFGSSTTGQLYYLGHGDPTDARIAYVNNDGLNHTSFVDNGPTVDLITNFPMEVGVDTAAGFYFALVSGNPVLGNGTRLVRGSLSGGAVTTLVTYDGPNNVLGTDDDEIINAIHVDVIGHFIYVGIQEASGGVPAESGIRRYSYNPTTGAISDLGFLVTVASSGKGPESGFNGIFDVRDFDVDPTNGMLFFTELLTGGVQANGLFRLSIASPNTITQMVIQSQFPDAGTNGFIIDVEVDSSTDLVYFTTQSQSAFGGAGYVAAQNAIWYVAETATNATATQLVLTGLPGGHRFYGGDMVLDQATRQLYVESEETDDGSGADDDVIYVFQLNAAGTSAALINTVTIIPPLNNIAANLGGMIFNNIAVLTGLAATATPAGEQGSALQLLTAAPTITDSDGTHLSSATVQITGGIFSSNQSNATADRLFFGPTLAASGSVAGTSITWAYNSATNTLTFTGYDTVDNYETALAGVRFQSLTDNPTNYGLNPTRTVTWTVSDGALGVPGGSVNSGTTQLTITAVNDAPVNNVAGTLNLGEDAVDIGLSGMSIADPDANPGITDITVTLTVTQGTIEILTNIAGGIEAGDITGGANNSATITITATLNQINATLAQNNGLTYTPTANYNGADTLTVVTNDGGNTGTGGALSDTDVRAINISAVNDAPTVIDATQTAATILEDTPSAAGETVSSLFTTSFSDALDQQQTGGNPTGSVANTLAGIAVVGGSTGASGSWQYFNGTIWVNIGAATTASAVLISAGTAIRFNPALNFNGSPPDLIVHLVDSSGAAITNGATVNLTGATGGTTRYSSATVALSESVTAVNDAPVNTVGGTLTVAEDSGATAVTGMSISDVDANPATDVFTVTLDVLHGTLNVLTSVPGGLGAGNVSGNGSATVILTGTINQINATLAAAGGVTYTPTGNYNGSDRVQVTTDDGGATGLDPGATGTATSESDTDSKTINVTAANDPVTTAAPPTLTLAEDATNVAVAGLSISDVDATLAPAGVYDVTLASTNGTMTLTTLAGLTFTVGDGTSDATMTFHGTLAAINTALATATYTPTGNYNGPATITLSATDTFGGIVATGTGAATSDSDVITVTIDAVNDPVSTAAPTTLMLNEDATNVAVAGLSISDVDATLAPAGVYEVTLTSTNGTMTLTTLAGLTFTAGDGTADATMTFHGTLAAINTALATAAYTPTANYNGSATITLSATDTFGGIVATGTGAATSDSDIINVTVTAQNDTPVVAVAASASSTEQVAGTIDAAATITDLELGALDNYAGSALTVGRNGGAQAEDLLTFGASGAFTVNGANLEAPGGLVFATFAGGNGTALVINFTGSGTPATQALVNAVVQSLQYTYTGDTPPASIVMNYSFDDGAPANAGQGGGGSPIGTDAITINITDTPENAAPTLDLDGDDSNTAGTGYTASFTEGGAAVLITDSDVAIADADVGDMIEGATIAINSPVAGDQLVLGAQGGFVVTGSGTGTITITGTGTAAQYEAMLEQITFSNGTDDPGASRTINITVTDGIGTSNIAVATINIAEINDEPTLTATAVNPTFTEGGAQADLFSGVTADTIEAGQTFASLTLTVTNVTDGANEILVVDGMNVALTNGNVVATGAGNVTVTLAGSTATVVVGPSTLSEAALQTLIDGLAYLNTSENPTDADRVVTITQLVDSGSDTSPNDATLAPGIASTVNVNPINDTPINTVPGTQTINEDASVTLSTGNGNAIQVADADATTLTVSLTVLHGTLTLASTAGLSFGAGDGTADTTMTFSGTAAAINAALGSGLTYNPNANFNGSDSIAVFTTDNGQSGGAAQTDSDSVTVNITAINDAPVVIGDGTESATTINEDTPGAGQTIQALFAGQYSDAADNQVPNGGASSPGQFSGIAVTANGSSASTGQWQYFSGGVWTDIGAASDAAAKLLGDPFVTLIRFNPAPDYNGPAPTLTVHLIDNSLPFGIVNGQVVDLSGPGATGGTTAYSTGTVVLSQDVTAVNDAPLNTVPGTQTINEDASVTLSTGNGNAIQVADVDATTVTVTLTVLHGTLTLASTLGLSFGAGDGTGDTTMTFSGTAAAINAALGSGLTYNPNANFNGSDSIAILTTDNGQTGTGGTLQDNDSVTINITAINDAPVVIGDGTESATTINEDTPGAGQTIQALFAGQYSDAADNQIPNGGASSPGQFSGIAVTANGSSASTGQWQYFSGGVWTDIGAASDAAAKLLGDPFVTLIRFNPAPDYNGPAPTLTVHLIDNSLPFGIVNGQVVDISGPGATGGTTAYSTGTVVLSQDITAVNDAPVNTVPGAQTINEDALITFSSGNGNMISVSDVDAGGGTITTTLDIASGALFPLPTGPGGPTVTGAGTNHVVISGTVAQVNGVINTLIYQPAANANGPFTLTITTEDNGNAGTGGNQVDIDTVTININSVNDAPSGADNTLTGSEDDPLVLTAADFGFTDPVEGNAFLAVIIDTFPANGTLFLDSDGPGGAAPVNLSTLGPGVFVSVTDINLGHLYFQPDADEFGNGYATFTFRVQDDGGMLNGGVDRDPVANTITFNITPDNLPPVVDLDGATGGVNYTTTFVEDGAAVAIGSGVSVTDPNSGIGDLIESATITLTDRVAGDSLTLTGALPPGIVAVTTPSAGAITITLTGTGTGAQYQALIQSIQYATTSQDPTVGGTDPARTVTVTVNDGLVDSAVATTTINVTAIDDPADAQNDDFTITESGTIVAGNLFANNGWGADSDPDGPPLAIASVTGGPGANVGAQFTLDSGALLTVYANGTFDYNPNGIFLPTPTAGSGASNTPGQDTFSYTLAGGDTAIVTITLTGLDTDDTLLGTAGTDILAGGDGNDTYYVENGSDQVIETSTGGNDRVIASVSYALAAGTYVETLEAAAAAGGITLVGNEFDQLILGNGDNNVLFGGLGNDVLEGGAGSDILYGEGGADTSRGGTGDDVYVVDATGDVTEESSFEGNDAVLTQVSYGLTTGASVELLSTTVHAGTSAINLTGNYLDQTIIGNYGANIITGGVGADVLIGLNGDDTYIIHDSTASVIEDAGGGNDLVYTSVSYTLGAGSQVEALSTTFHAGTAAIDLTGNSFAQAIYGNGAANTIRSGGGADGLYGFAGNDTYFVSSGTEQVFEQVGHGNDAVYSTGSYTLAAGQEIEFLSADNFAADTDIALTGNEFANTIYGNDGDNILDGKGGNDALVGLAGEDKFAFTTALGANNVDLVFGFQHDVDEFWLDNAIFTEIGLDGTLSSDAFHTGAAAHDATDRIIYNSATGQLFYDRDGSGTDFAMIQFATTSPGLALSHTDFLVI